LTFQTETPYFIGVLVLNRGKSAEVGIFQDIFGLNLTHSSFLAFNIEQAQNGASLYQAIKQSIHQSP